MADPGTPASPDPRLVAAAAMVFVADPSLPVLTEGDVHHLLQVLRLRPGEVVAASDGRGAWTRCRLSGSATSTKGDRDDILVVDGPVEHATRPTPAITIGFVPTKGDRPEWVTQKLTELGVDRVVPLQSRRSVVRWQGERGEKAVERLRRVAREAAAQCRRPWLPEVGDVTSLDAFGAAHGSTACLAQPGGTPPTLARPVVAIGPEGGWDDEEIAQFGPGIGLGGTVLRAETATVAAGTLLCALRSGVVRGLA